MSGSTIQILNFENQEVRTTIKDGEIFWVLKDVCEILGIQNYRNVAAKLGDDEKGVHQMDTLGGRQKFIIVNEPGLYRTIFRSDKPEAKNFMRWVTHEVLPTIRKYGAYVSQEKLAEITRDPNNLVRLVNSFMEENKQLRLQLELDQPKVLFATAISNSSHTLLVGELSKIIQSCGGGITPNKMFEWLREKGYLMKRRGASYNSPTQKSMKLGLFSIRESVTINADGAVTISRTVKVTGKEQIYFVNRFLKKPLAPDNQLSFQDFLSREANNEK